MVVHPVLGEGSSLHQPCKQIKILGGSFVIIFGTFKVKRLKLSVPIKKLLDLQHTSAHKWLRNDDCTKCSQLLDIAQGNFGQQAWPCPNHWHNFPSKSALGDIVISAISDWGAWGARGPLCMTPKPVKSTKIGQSLLFLDRWPDVRGGHIAVCRDTWNDSSRQPAGQTWEWRPRLASISISILLATKECFT